MAPTMEQAIWSWAMGVSGGTLSTSNNGGWVYEAGKVFVATYGRVPCTLEEWEGWLRKRGILPAWSGWDRNPSILINPGRLDFQMAPYPPTPCPDGTDGCSKTPWNPCGSGGTTPGGGTGGGGTTTTPNGGGSIIPSAEGITSWINTNPLPAVAIVGAIAYFLFLRK